MKWRWALLPLSPIAIPVGFLVGLIAGTIRALKKPKLENYTDKEWFKQRRG